MNREESIEDFRENIAKKLIQECELEFKENLENNFERLKKVLTNGIRGVIKKSKEIQKIDSNYKLFLIQFEFLRIYVLNDKYKVYISGYNQSMFLDKNAVNEEVDLQFLFNPLISLKENLISNKKIYLGKVNNYDIEIIICNLAEKLFRSIVEEARVCMWNIDEEEWLDNDIMEPHYFIKWSEYHGKGEIIFAMDNRKKSSNDFMELKKYSTNNRMPYIYTVWKDCYLDDCDVSSEKMLFINFKRGKLKNINFKDNYLVKSQFKESELKECCFDNTVLVASSFEKAVIKDSSFKYADLRNVDFKNCNLDNIDFKDSDLSNSIFVNFTFNNISFENAKLEGAIFSEKDIAFLHLSPQQIQDIYIYGGK